jgi:hypothetical protein
VVEESQYRPPVQTPNRRPVGLLAGPITPMSVQLGQLAQPDRIQPIFSELRNDHGMSCAG